MSHPWDRDPALTLVYHTLGVGVAAGKKEWLTVAGKRATWQNHMVSQVADASGISGIGVA